MQLIFGLSLLHSFSQSFSKLHAQEEREEERAQEVGTVPILLGGGEETKDNNKLNEFQVDTMAHYVVAINLWQLYSNYPALIEKFLSAPQSA